MTAFATDKIWMSILRIFVEFDETLRNQKKKILDAVVPHSIAALLYPHFVYVVFYDFIYSFNVKIHVSWLEA